MFKEFDFVSFVYEGQKLVGTIFEEFLDELYNEDGDLVEEESTWYRVAIENSDNTIGRVVLVHESDILALCSGATKKFLKSFKKVYYFKK